jgi:large subunit ribosomal protein LP2
MRILAAYLLAVLGGNPNPDKAAIKKILSATKPPISAPDDRIDQLLKELQGKDLDQLIEEGKKKIGSAPAGGGGGAPAAGGAGKPAEKKEETKPPISAPDDRIDQLLKELQGKDLDQLIEEGKKKIGSAPAGGGGGAPAAGGAGKPAEKKEEAKKEPEPEPEEEESGMAGLFD